MPRSQADIAPAVRLLRVSRVYAGKIRPGVMVSLLLHGGLAFLLLHRLSQDLQVPRFVPADIVVLAEETASPPQQSKGVVPQQQRVGTQQQRSATLQRISPQSSRMQPSIPNPTADITPPGEAPVRDELQTRLEALAMLRQADTDPRPGRNSGNSSQNASSGDAGLGPQPSYRVEDFIRAQIERRWNLDIAAVGKRNIPISIHLVLDRDGTVTQAEIVDQKRYTTDADYRSIALSARNAALLSSPLAFPAGKYDGALEMTLTLNPKDVLR